MIFCQQHPDPGRMIDDHRVDDVTVRLTPLDRIHDRAVLGIQVEQDADVPELQVGVHQADTCAGLLAQGQRQVRGDRGSSSPALWREDSNDLVFLDVGGRPIAGPSCRRHGGRQLAAPRELTLVDGLDAGREEAWHRCAGCESDLRSHAEYRGRLQPRRRVEGFARRRSDGAGRRSRLPRARSRGRRAALLPRRREQQLHLRRARGPDATVSLRNEGRTT